MKKDKKVSVERASTAGGNRWVVKVDDDWVARLPRRKAIRRASGIQNGIMNHDGRCLTRAERGLPPKVSHVTSGN